MSWDDRQFLGLHGYGDNALDPLGFVERGPAWQPVDVVGPTYPCASADCPDRLGAFALATDQPDFVRTQPDSSTLAITDVLDQWDRHPDYVKLALRIMLACEPYTVGCAVDGNCGDAQDQELAISFTLATRDGYRTLASVTGNPADVGLSGVTVASDTSTPSLSLSVEWDGYIAYPAASGAYTGDPGNDARRLLIPWADFLADDVVMHVAGEYHRVFLAAGFDFAITATPYWLNNPPATVGDAFMTLV